MAKLSVQQIRERAIEIIQQSPGGIRYSELIGRILQQSPETPKNTVHGAVWDLDRRFPELVHKPIRGVFQAKAESSSSPTVPPPSKLPREEDFYQPFADWLTNELEEVTVAVPLGGAGLQKKWGTPDVVGVYKPLASHRIKFDIEIVSAEIKVDPTQPVVAFGQAAAYRLFSAKSYVVMPRTIPLEDYGRLESLCLLFGIGLVLFQPDIEQPDFEIRVRAQRYYPDMYYVNEFADRLYQIDPSLFNQLFG
jgi:hypothetical protein